MNPFEKHSIKHLSPSSLNLFRAAPARWVMSYLFKVRDSAGPAAWRGIAVEAGAQHLLYGSNMNAATAAMMENFEANAQGEVSDEIDKERAVLPGMLEQAGKAFLDWPRPVAKQMKIEHWFDGVSVPLIGYIDFIFDDCLVDLKTTKALPSAPKAAHCRQVALYEAAKGKPAKLAYVTAKKHAVYDVDTAAYLTELRRDALTLQALLDKCDTPNEVAQITPLDLDSFYWSDLGQANQAIEIWENAA
jgi:hypothetical protein